MPRGAFLLLATLGVLAAGPTCARARAISGDAFLCMEAKAARAGRGEPAPPTFHSRVGVSVVDRFTLPFASERYTLDLKKAEDFCWPVRLDGEEPTDPLSGLETYDARRTRRKPSPPPLPTAIERIETAFGEVTLKIGGVDVLAVPTLATGSVGGIGPARDHFACYQVRQERAAGERRAVVRVDVRSADAVQTLELRKPKRLCVPANVRGDDPTSPKHPLDVLCWDARVPRGGRSPGSAGPLDDALVATRNGFGLEVLHLGAARQLCLPAARTAVVLPTPTPFPTLTPSPTPVLTPLPARLRVEPTSATGLVRDRLCFAAVVDLPDGSTGDITATALWRAADGAIAVPSGFLDGKRCFIGVGIGSTSLTARDAVTGLVSPPATVMVDWPIFALTVTPDQVGIRIGGDETLTVTAKLAGNRTRNVTQHVVYASADPTIAQAPNASGNRSRIAGIGSGRTTIAVTDTLSSIGGSANVVVGALQSIRIDPDIPPLFPGESGKLKTVGVYDAGFVGNLTQQVSYESSDPTVVVATNAAGDRSRVEAVRPGTALVTATDLPSGLRSSCCGTVGVIGNLLSLGLTPNRFEHRAGIGEPPIRFRARGFFEVPPSSHVDRVVSDRVMWSSSDEAILVPDRVDVDGYERFRVVGGGTATVAATYGASGIVASAPVAVFDHLDRIEVGTSDSDPAELEARAIQVGDTSRYVAHGYFDGGRHRLLNDLRYSVSDPDVAEWTGGGSVRGLRPGTVTISAIDGPSGRSSGEAGGRSATLQVYGFVDRLVLSPRTLNLERGQVRTLTAVGHHAGGAAENLTQRVVYTSSDPSVVEAPNEVGNLSRIVAKAAGTATISATDPATGVRSTTSGDDTIVTVHDDPLVSILVTPRSRRVAVGSSPRFTATGRLASGATQNLTQRVEWSSSDPLVAAARNDDGDRSRVDALDPGTTVLTVRDPVTGITSTDSGEDATLTVEALTSLVLAPATLEINVGDAFSLTTIGTVAGADPVNVTQEAFYTSSDPSVVLATNQTGNRSRIEGLAPGVATVTAFRASAYPQATDSNAITITVFPAE